MAQVSSVDHGQDMVVDAHLANEGDGWAGSGANPWHLDEETESILFLTNASEKPARIGFGVTANDVPYYLTLLQVDPHETRAINLRQLRDAQAPDFRGNKIPAEATDGSVNWIRLDNVPVSGRMLVLKRHGGIASNYNCTTCYCPPGYTSLSVSPGSASVTPGGTAQYNARSAFTDCNYFTYYYDVTPESSWGSGNTSVATVNGAGLATGQGGGSTSISATYYDCTYHWNVPEQMCDERLVRRSTGGTLNVAEITGGSAVWWFNGQTPSGYTTTITLTALPSGASYYGWSIVAGTDKATLSGQSGNTIHLTGNDLSTTLNDVTVRCEIQTSGGNGVAGKNITVRGPYKLVPTGFVDESDPTWGYQSFLNYDVQDNWGSLLPYSVPINEQWTTGLINDYQGANWRQSVAGYYVMPSSAFADHIQGETSDKTPSPSSPQSPLGSTAVDHWGQAWYVGETTNGLGAPVQLDTFQKYVDHARHLSITSPW